MKSPATSGPPCGVQKGGKGSLYTVRGDWPYLQPGLHHISVITGTTKRWTMRRRSPRHGTAHSAVFVATPRRVPSVNLSAIRSTRAVALFRTCRLSLTRTHRANLTEALAPGRPAQRPPEAAR